MKRVLGTIAVLCVLGATASATDPAAQSLIEGGHWKRLRAMADARLKANPNDPEANYLSAYAKWAFRDLDGAQPLAEKAVSLDGKNADYHFLLGRIIGQRAENAGIFKGLSYTKQFRKECEAALAINPNHLDALDDLKDFYEEAPGIAGGDKKKAAEIADRMTKIDPVRGYLAQVDLANHEKNKDWGKIESLERKAVEANPQSYVAEIALAGLYATDAFKKYGDADVLARAAMKTDPTRSSGYAVVAQVLVYQDRWSELDSLLAEAEKAVPDDLNPMYQAARVMLVTGKDLSRAEGYFRKYLTQEPEGQTPRIAPTHWRLGLVLEKEGRKQEAIAEIQTAVQLEPDLEPAKKDLKRLK